jgi:hypothetical protein
MIDELFNAAGTTIGKKILIGKAAAFGSFLGPIGAIVAGGGAALILYGGNPFRAALGAVGGSHILDGVSALADASDAANAVADAADTVATVATVTAHAADIAASIPDLVDAGSIVADVALDLAPDIFDAADTLTGTAIDGLAAVPNVVVTAAIEPTLEIFTDPASVPFDVVHDGLNLAPAAQASDLVQSAADAFGPPAPPVFYVSGSGVTSFDMDGGVDVQGNERGRDAWGNGPRNGQGNDSRDNMYGWHGRTYRPA